MNNRKIFFKVLPVVLMLIICVTGIYFKVSRPLGCDEGKSVSSNMISTKKLMPVGAAVGIHIQTDGLMVLGTADISTVSGEKVSPAKNLVKSGDYIVAVNGKKVSNTAQMEQILNASGEKTVELTVLRDDQSIEIQINPAKTGENAYKAGIWIRDDTQGIGTLSFIDEKNRFAALGHGIADVDTGDIIQISGGGLYPANVYAIVRGGSNQPGEMVGHILYGQTKKFAMIKDNTSEGIYGTLSENCVYAYDEKNALNVGLKEEMHIGEASIRCQIDGVIDDYDVWISGIDFNGSNKNKDFVIEVKDKRLLDATGGIVQGMSGSPVIQDNKIVGVVTHVFLNNAGKGYGIFIEKMLEREMAVFGEE